MTYEGFKGWQSGDYSSSILAKLLTNLLYIFLLSWEPLVRKVVLLKERKRPTGATWSISQVPSEGRASSSRAAGVASQSTRAMGMVLLKENKNINGNYVA